MCSQFWDMFCTKADITLQKDKRDLNLQNQIFSFSYSENVILNDLSFQSIEDFILLVGTSVAFIAFILWCCFPIEPKDSLGGSEHLTTQVIKGVLSEYWLKSVHFFSTNKIRLLQSKYVPVFHWFKKSLTIHRYQHIENP